MLSPAERNRRRFYSDANSALRKSYWCDHPYAEVNYAEDQLFGAEVLADGFVKAYDPKASVYHSHSLPLREHFMRRFDEFLGLAKNGDLTGEARLSQSLANGVLRWLHHVWDLWKARDFSLPRKIFWTAYGMPFAAADSMAAYAAMAARKRPQKLLFLSHENMLKNREAADDHHNS